MLNPQTNNPVDEANMLVAGLNYAVNLEILQIVSETLALNRRSSENAREFYAQALSILNGIAEKIK